MYVAPAFLSFVLLPERRNATSGGGRTDGANEGASPRTPFYAARSSTRTGCGNLDGGIVVMGLVRCGRVL